MNTLRPRQNGRHFADDIFKCIFLNENAWISLKISLKFVPKVRINYIPALVQIMAWHRPGDKPLSEPMMVSLLTHICVTRPQWVNIFMKLFCKHLILHILYQHISLKVPCRCDSCKNIQAKGYFHHVLFHFAYYTKIHNFQNRHYPDLHDDLV